MNKFIPVNTPLLNGNEGKYLQECINSGWISSEGPFVEEFENKFAAYVGRKYGISCSNGSAALDIALAALQLGPGDEIIMPTFTIISPALSIIRAGATPILVDSQPDTWNMDIQEIENKITARTKAILVVHIYGLPVDMDPVLSICKKYKLKLIEDAAEMHGQTYKGKMCGTFGDISTFSFYPNKHITTGEGGMCLTDDADLAERCKKLKNLAFENKGRRFVHHELGWNYRMTNLQAAIGLAQLEKITEHVDKKRHLGQYYQQTLENLRGFQMPLSRTSYSENIYWVFGLVADNQSLAEDAINYLSQNNIGTRPFFWCMHEQPIFQKMLLFQNENYPIAERIARCGFYIPCGLGITKEESEVVVDVLKKFNKI